MRKYFQTNLIRDSLWVLGGTILLVLFLIVSFYVSRNLRDEEHLNMLQQSKEILEDKILRDSETLKLMQVRIQSLEPKTYEKQIPSFLKDNYQTRQKRDNEFTAKYYLSLKGEPALFSSLGKVDNPTIALETLTPRIKHQNNRQALYFEGDSLYHVLIFSMNF